MDTWPRRTSILHCMTESADLAAPGKSEIGSTAPVSVLIPTFNEELNIDACLESVVGWADDIIVVDSFSTDKTEEIARSFPIPCIQHAYESPPEQWDSALTRVC